MTEKENRGGDSSDTIQGRNPEPTGDDQGDGVEPPNTNSDSISSNYKENGLPVAAKVCTYCDKPVEMDYADNCLRCPRCSECYCNDCIGDIERTKLVRLEDAQKKIEAVDETVWRRGFEEGKKSERERLKSKIEERIEELKPDEHPPEKIVRGNVIRELEELREELEKEGEGGGSE